MDRKIKKIIIKTYFDSIRQKINGILSIKNKKEKRGETMQYYNLKVVLLLKRELKQEETYEKLGDFIAFAMLKDRELKQLHERSGYKNYVFCNLYPVQKEGVYLKGNLYTFDIRFIQIELAMKMKQVIHLTEDENFKVIVTSLQTHEQRKIKTLITLTPTVITTDRGDYRVENKLEFVKNRITANIQKKYNQTYQIEARVDFIEKIEQINRIPIKIPYKQFHILANKYEMTIKPDPVSQDLAYLALSIGVAEKNSSLGMGFCKAR